VHSKPAAGEFAWAVNLYVGLDVEAEAMFMGVMKPAVDYAGSVKAWLMPGGWGCIVLELLGLGTECCIEDK
jgi:hypothetical protein